jgi:hypothetical protein
MSACEKAAILGGIGFTTGFIIGGVILLSEHPCFNIKGRHKKFLKLVKFIRAREIRNNKQKDMGNIDVT